MLNHIIRHTYLHKQTILGTWLATKNYMCVLKLDFNITLIITLYLTNI